MNGYIFPKEVISQAREKLATRGVEGVDTKDLLLLIGAYFHEEMQDLKSTLHEEMQGLRKEMQGLREEMQGLRATLPEEMQGLREEMQGLRATLTGEIDDLKREMRDMKKSFKVIGWWVATACTGIAGSLIAGLIIELLKK